MKNTKRSRDYTIPAPTMQKRFPLNIIIGLLAMTGGLYAAIQTTRDVPEPRRAAPAPQAALPTAVPGQMAHMDIDLTAPVPPPPTLTAPPPALPTFPPMRADWRNGLSVGTDVAHEIERRTRIMISEHPEPIVREELLQLLDERSIMLTFLDDAKGPRGVFATHPPNANNPNWLPFIMLQPKLIAEAKNREDIGIAMLVFYHEFLHYKQWERAKTPAEKNFFSHKTNLQPMTQEECAYKWDVEHEAHLKTCEVMLRWGVTSGDLQCLRLQVPIEFEKDFFLSLVQPNEQPQCNWVWMAKFKQAVAALPPKP